jgi:2-polyprenyl-3-methyl-5-hydroxy-6-metoxy-1,4-benzoquinol methylase
MPKTKTANINDNYFDGFYKEIWRSVIPEELTAKETEFILDYFQLKPGNKVLDMMCGYGRHAIALAKNGITVTAIDNLNDYINEIKRVAEKEKLPLTAICDDVLDFQTSDKFDLAICMGNSLNFFNENDSVSFLSQLSSCLKSGGNLLINTWSLAETVIKTFKDKTWSKIGDYTFLTDSKFLFHPARVETETIMIAADGTTETKKAIDYVFSVNEMENLLDRSGFILKENFSIPRKKKFAIGEPRAYIIAEKK